MILHILYHFIRYELNISQSDALGWSTPQQDHVDRVIFERDPGVSLAVPGSSTDGWVTT